MKPLKKILHVLWSARFGGIERLVLDLAVAQSRLEGTEVGVMFGQGQGEMLGAFRESGVRCHFLGLNSGYDISPWKYTRAMRAFRWYDVLHFHSFNPLLAISAALSGKRVVYTEHGNFGFGRRRTASDSVKDRLLAWFLKRHVDHVTYNSFFTKRIADGRYGPLPRSSVLYNGVSFDEARNGAIEERILEKLRGRFVVGTSSRFAGFKRIDRLIEGFHGFQHGKDAVLLLVGDGPMRGELEAMARKLGIADRAVFTGYRGNVRDFQALMDVCVFPSDGEPFGLAAVEALSLGKPTVVFSDGGGMAEVVGGLSGEDIVDDVRGLTDRLEMYYRDREAISLHEARRKGHARRFDIKEMARCFDDIYGRVMRKCAG